MRPRIRGAGCDKRHNRFLSIGKIKHLVQRTRERTAGRHELGLVISAAGN
jgi:hypothetical protein